MPTASLNSDNISSLPEGAFTAAVVALTVVALTVVALTAVVTAALVEAESVETTGVTSVTETDSDEGACVEFGVSVTV